MKDSFRFSGKWTLNKIYGNTWAFSVKEKAFRGEEEEEEGVVGARGAVSESLTSSFRRRRRWRRRIWGDSFGGVKGRERGRRRSAGRKEGKGEVRCPDFFFYSKL
ncbi:hypothetical protein TIFTF001_053575 [Ficus carica]|uniref:Uncharacterized protein n=1 Tax=Ficus carica TaxID=3494 RepID=A0AA88ED16_FICCA|nr:hypothetical protein TIFTF001_053574 [Ficus carica]GMN72507.1 hypothetical protein TIFTF001_053575 [Ficus carica]